MVFRLVEKKKFGVKRVEILPLWLVTGYRLKIPLTRRIYSSTYILYDIGHFMKNILSWRLDGPSVPTSSERRKETSTAYNVLTRVSLFVRRESSDF